MDTGSTDGTQDIIREHFKDIPGELHERPWQDFAHNRSEALALARPHADYSFIIDADDALEFDPGFAMPELTAGSYSVEIADTATQYSRPQLVRNTQPWRYEGVLHEYLTCEGSPDSGDLTGMRMRRNHDGARRKDPETYRRDAAILEAALQTETSPFLISRYRFYLAQSYRDCGEKARALENYLARAELGFWQEEVFIALYQAAKMKEDLGHPEQEVIDAYLRAHEAAPHRAEALHGASRFCRIKDRFAEGYKFAVDGLRLEKKSSGEFVEHWVYDYGLLDEFSVNAYWIGNYNECLDSCQELLYFEELPDYMKDRILSNAKFAAQKMGYIDIEIPKITRYYNKNKNEKAIKFHIIIISINEHDQLFNDIVSTLSKSLSDLGYLCTITKNRFEESAVNIVLGSVVFAAKFGWLHFLDDKKFVIYQLEQINENNYALSDEYRPYIELLDKSFYILEYSPAGMKYFLSLGWAGLPE